MVVGRASPRFRVAVVGAGAGGLACAAELARAGCDVTVLDRASSPGGKIRTIDVGGVPVDAGPTVLTMRWVFDELFALGGRSFDDYVRLERAEVVARHAWPDGSRLDLFADHERSVAAIAAFAGADEAARYRAFADHTRRIYETVEGPFIRAHRPTFGTLIHHAGALGLGALARIDAHRTLWRALEGAFGDPRLRQLFGRYATYCGSSPFEAPATLALVAHVEAGGVHRVAGGMSALARGLERLGRDLGVTFRYQAEVARVLVRRGCAAGVELESGEEIEADAVVVNADVSAIGSGLFGADVARGAPRTPPRSRSLSAVTWAIAGRASGFPLVHHNVFFSSDYRAEFLDIAEGRAPRAPTVYVCAQDRGDAAIEPAEERFLIIVNAPATGDAPAAWSDEERLSCETNTLSTMQRCGLTLSPRATQLTTPVELHRSFPGTGGALYGPIARGPLSSLAREGSRTRVPRLYLAGGSVHPGPGVPMATLSGRLAAASVREDLASIARSRTVATSGSTSTA